MTHYFIDPTAGTNGNGLSPSTPMNHIEGNSFPGTLNKIWIRRAGTILLTMDFDWLDFGVDAFVAGYPKPTDDYYADLTLTNATWDADTNDQADIHASNDEKFTNVLFFRRLKFRSTLTTPASGGLPSVSYGSIFLEMRNDFTKGGDIYSPTARLRYFGQSVIECVGRLAIYLPVQTGERQSPFTFYECEFTLSEAANSSLALLLYTREFFVMRECNIDITGTSIGNNAFYHESFERPAIILIGCNFTTSGEVYDPVVTLGNNLNDDYTQIHDCTFDNTACAGGTPVPITLFGRLSARNLKVYGTGLQVTLRGFQGFEIAEYVQSTSMTNGIRLIGTGSCVLKNATFNATNDINKDHGVKLTLVNTPLSSLAGPRSSIFVKGNSAHRIYDTVGDVEYQSTVKRFTNNTLAFRYNQVSDARRPLIYGEAGFETLKVKLRPGVNIITIYGAYSVVNPSSNDFWVDLEYEANDSNYRTVNTTRNPLRQANPLSADVSTWTGGVTAIKVAFNVTVTKRQLGLIRLFYKAYHATNVFYVDPRIEVS